MAKLKVEWANSRALKAKIRPERDDLRPGWSLGGMDRWMDGQTEGWTDGRMSENSPLWPTGHRPFDTAAQKSKTSECNLYTVELCSNRTTTYRIPHIMNANPFNFCFVFYDCFTRIPSLTDKIC